MKDFMKRHAPLHIWALVLTVLFGGYAWAISSRGAANAVVAVTQTLKDTFAVIWYIFPFSVVEWFYEQWNSHL